MATDSELLMLRNFLSYIPLLFIPYCIAKLYNVDNQDVGIYWTIFRPVVTAGDRVTQVSAKAYPAT